MQILHVIGGMNRGGPETWLMNVLRHIDRQKYRLDFLVHTDQPCAYDEEVRNLGSKIIPCLQHNRPISYARNFKQVLREHGPYDIVHSHVQYFSGFVLRLAYRYGVPGRIAHNLTPSYGQVDALQQTSPGIFRRGYIALMRRWIARYATTGLVVNREGGADLFGPNWESDPRFRILYLGLDFAPFQGPVDPQAVRAALGIPLDAFVVGNVSRFFKQKNHPFLLEILASLLESEPKAHLLLIGDGPLQAVVEEQAASMGLASRVTFTGSRPDLAPLMRGAMDVFLFPSLAEGLPAVVVLAQAAGLPCLLSQIITTETDIIPTLIQRLSLSQSAAAWADAVLAVRDAPRPVTQPDALALINQSPFNNLTSLHELERIYQAEVARESKRQSPH